MAENEKYLGDEKLLILPLGEESKKITQVISNDTARQIIELLADAPLSANDIAQRLQAPLSTITYNLENLESVGLIMVEKIKYSEKGREVKIYAPVRKLIVLVPEKTDRSSVADILRKYLGIILTAFFASSLIEFFMRTAGMNTNLLQTNSESYSLPTAGISQLPAITNTSVGIVNETINGGDIAGIAPIPAAKMVPPMPTQEVQSIQPDIFTNISNTIIAHPGLVFFMGCMFMIALFIIMDYRRKRNNR
jgi:predicted transcriptional regulator